MKIKVQITETSQRVIELDVVSEEVAIGVVKQQYADEEIVLDWNDNVGIEFEVVK